MIAYRSSHLISDGKIVFVFMLLHYHEIALDAECKTLRDERLVKSRILELRLRRSWPKSVSSYQRTLGNDREATGGTELATWTRGWTMASDVLLG